MSLENLSRSTIAVLLSAIATFSAGALAQLPVSATTGGDLCAPVNVAKANRTIQNLRGSIANISATEEIAVSCPLVTYFPTTNVSVTAVVQNDGAIAQTPRCVLRQVESDNFVRTTTRQNVTIPAGSNEGLVFDDIVLNDPLNRLNLTCLLPPGSSLGGLITDSL